jgi:predicted extracellular nuclease
MTVPFSFMTWNVENLFPAGHPPGPKTQEDYDQKMSNLARTILSIAPDVLAVQEIGAESCFKDLQNHLNGLYPYAVLSNKPDGTPNHQIRVGLLSRFPLSQADDFYDFDKTALVNVPEVEGNKEKIVTHMGRGALKTIVTLPQNLSITVVTAHLKSKLLTFPKGRRYPLDEDERARGAGYSMLKRTAEAVALRVYINRLVSGNDTPLILAGDFNSETIELPIQILQGPEDASLQHKDKGDDVRLYNLDDHIMPEHRYSRIFRKQKELIDHILVSYELIFGVRQVDSFVQNIASIDQGVETRRSALFPDHAPIFARFEIPEPTI